MTPAALWGRGAAKAERQDPPIVKRDEDPDRVGPARNTCGVAKLADCPTGDHKRHRTNSAAMRKCRNKAKGRSTPKRRSAPAKRRNTATDRERDREQKAWDRQTEAQGKKDRARVDIVQRRALNRKWLAEQVGGQAGLAFEYAFMPDGFYESVADRLLEATERPRRWRRWLLHRHWLCNLLNEVAVECSTGTYVDLVKEETLDVLRSRLKIGKAVAVAITELVGVGAKITITAFAGSPTLPTQLRILIVLVCPDLQHCHASDDVCKEFLGPSLAWGLRNAGGA